MTYRWRRFDPSSLCSPPQAGRDHRPDCRRATDGRPHTVRGFFAGVPTKKSRAGGHLGEGRVRRAGLPTCRTTTGRPPGRRPSGSGGASKRLGAATAMFSECFAACQSKVACTPCGPESSRGRGINGAPGLQPHTCAAPRRRAEEEARADRHLREGRGRRAGLRDRGVIVEAWAPTAVGVRNDLPVVCRPASTAPPPPSG